jgi:hypothetical protein
VTGFTDGMKKSKGHDVEGKANKLPLYFTKHYAMKAYGNVEVYLHLLLTSAIV